MKRTSEAARRLSDLVRRGYVPMNDSSDGVWLWHPSKPASHPDLVLHPEGDVSSAEPDEFFFADGPERWAAFLDTVPRPNWWERGQAARDKFVGTVMIPVVLPVALVFAVLFAARRMLGY